jgi:hypothetical protein
VKVAYPIEYQKNATPPPRRIGMIPRWKDVTDRLPALVEKGGVIVIRVPRQGIKKEINSLRNAILRARQKQGIEERFSVQIADEGIKVWRMEENDDD